MKAKKLMAGFTLFAFAALLGACSPDNAGESSASSTEATTSAAESSEATETSTEATPGVVLKDGTYNLEEENYNNGYRVTFSIVVKDGKIVESNYDNVNEAGKSKVEDEEYNKKMEEVAKNSPEKYIPALNESLLSTQDPEAMDVVTGATHSFHSFQNYAQQLIQAAQAGNTETIKIDNGADLKDGTYTIEQKNYSNGYRVAFSIVVKDGKVAESHYDNVNEAGESKTKDAEYNKMMKDKAGISPEEFIPAFNEALVAQMNSEEAAPGNVEVVSGATHSFHTFVLYAEQLINAAEKGDTTPIEVDNFVEAN
ncbi:FMN-binding protein [Enterococcus saccharolyticus]|uniref:FMN-binding protein n=1 Tax=Candidatus Enterococcus willemsii TaxID=1857215 RepID=A0ABQ6Z103_9ENTE|nr:MULTISPECIES: extracellular electron transfer flavoprotein PplA [Enterococcus]KAF1304635.1 FMN-binding protein [Enterococcus sp. CU12B]MCD5001367.1 FMN-binding protein [Enterococcus saccharolyticus]